MQKFKKRPVIVEAAQWFKQGDHPAVKPYQRIEMPGGYEKICTDENKGWIKTPKGGHIVTPGDWITLSM